MPSANLQIKGLSKCYGSVTALAPIDLDVGQGEFLTLLGPSGSGKTTLLSLIAGLILPDDGQLLINGLDVTYGAPYERDIGMVFQSYALFPHMTIEENICFPLKMRKVSSTEAKRRANDALGMVRLPHVAQRYPKELSGGQQQRIALARCMVYRPSIILMDEPLGALDKKLRDQMQLEIKRIHRELGATIVYVTHDQEEAMTLSDRICLMNNGGIEQLGAPDDLYFYPHSLFVADFLGESNLFDAKVSKVSEGLLDIALPGGQTGQASCNNLKPKVGDKVKIMIRPQNFHLNAMDMESDRAHTARLSGKVLDRMVTGSLTKLYIQGAMVDAAPIVVAYPTHRLAKHYAIGDTVGLDWQATDAIAIKE